MSIVAWDGSFFRVFLGQSSLLPSHPFDNTCFFYAFIQLKSQSVMDGREFLKSESIFQLSIFLNLAICDTWCMSTFWAFWSHNYFFMFLIQSSFLLYSFCSHIYSKIVLFLQHPVVDLCSYILQVVEFSIRYLEISCKVCITWSCQCIVWLFLLSPLSFDLSLQVTFCETCQLFSFGFFLPNKFLNVFPS